MLLRTIDDLYERVPWEKLGAVVFDVGNVLLRFDPQALLRLHLPAREELYPMLMEKVFRSPYWVMLDHGIVSTDEAIELMTGRDMELRDAIGTLMHGWVDLRETVDEGLFALQQAREHGKKTYVLSNYHHEAFPVVEKKYDFFSGFDGIVVSARLGIMKPNPAIYAHMTAKYGLTPARTLFIDDSPANVEGALYAGWQGLCYNRPGKIYEFFAG